MTSFLITIFTIAEFKTLVAQISCIIPRASRCLASGSLIRSRHVTTVVFSRTADPAAVISFQPVSVDKAGCIVRERPTPVFIASGEGMPPVVWQPLVQSLQERGFSGLVCPFPQGFGDTEKIGHFYQQVITTAQMTPPLMIADSVATLGAFKFLESFSLSGLALLNPLPQEGEHSLQSINRLRQLYMHQASNVQSTHVSNTHVARSAAQAVEDLKGITTAEGVVLEPRAVPMFVVLSDADTLLLGAPNGPIEKTLLHLCGLSEDEHERELLRLSGKPSQVFRASVSHSECIDALVDWLDEIA